jgi:hypothetical protein
LAKVRRGVLWMPRSSLRVGRIVGWPNCWRSGAARGSACPFSTSSANAALARGVGFVRYALPQSFQNPSKRSERSSVYRTVCMMLRWPRKCCSARRDQDCGRVAVGRTGNACGQHPGDGRLPSGLGIPAPADRRSAVGVLRRQWFNDRNGLSMSPERTRPGDLWQSGQFPHRSLRVDNSEIEPPPACRARWRVVAQKTDIDSTLSGVWGDGKTNFPIKKCNTNCALQ